MEEREAGLIPVLRIQRNTYTIYSTRTRAMKTKLTITVDKDLIPRAKRYARRRGVSLSSIIEDALRELTRDEAPSFAERWRGRFEPASRDDDRFRALADKYL